MPAKPDSPGDRSRFERFVRTMWWLHSLWALAFGVGVMIYARKGLAHADKLLVILGVSWLVVFGALRFIVGPDNVKPDDKLFKKGLRIGTNYIIKNLYQQMLFFLVPLYASSTTWSTASSNWWLAPILLLFAVLSTMDLVMDEFVMQRRLLASVMYAFCMFGVLNLMLPIATDLTQFDALLVAAASAVPAVALLTFRIASVFSIKGLSIVVAGTMFLAAGAYYGAEYVPPAPLSMPQGGVSHGTLGSREDVPGHKQVIPADQLDGLRCVARLTTPGELHDHILHVWTKDGAEHRRVEPQRVFIDGSLLDHIARVHGKPGEYHPVAPPREFTPTEPGLVYRSYAPALPAKPAGAWTCTIVTDDRQLVGRLAFEIR